MYDDHFHTSLDFRDRGLLEPEEIMKFECASYVGLRSFFLQINFSPLGRPAIYIIHRSPLVDTELTSLPEEVEESLEEMYQIENKVETISGQRPLPNDFAQGYCMD